MFFTSNFQFQQTIFSNNLSHKLSTLPRKCPLHSLPKTFSSNPTRPLLSDHNSSWLKAWCAKSRSRLLPTRPRAALDYRRGLSSDDEEFGASASTGSSTMSRIVEKLKKFGYVDDAGDVKEQPLPEKGSVEDIFYAEDGILPDSRGGLSVDLSEEVKFPWESVSDGDSVRRRKSKTVLAELTLPQGELRRLRHLAIRAKSRTKIGGAGVTNEVVDVVREKWETAEVVRLKCEGAPALNMKRMHEILEV